MPGARGSAVLLQPAPQMHFYRRKYPKPLKSPKRRERSHESFSLSLTSLLLLRKPLPRISYLTCLRSRGHTSISQKLPRARARSRQRLGLRTAALRGRVPSSGGGPELPWPFEEGFTPQKTCHGSGHTNIPPPHHQVLLAAGRGACGVSVVGSPKGRCGGSSTQPRWALGPQIHSCPAPLCSPLSFCPVINFGPVLQRVSLAAAGAQPRPRVRPPKPRPSSHR